MDKKVDKKDEFEQSGQENAESDKNRKRVKRLKWTLIIMAVLMVLGLGLNLYERWQGQRDVEELKVELEEWEKAIFEEKYNDTVGGATPQETLDMFISAVEKGDYALASTYFILEKQKEWRENLIEITEKEKNNIFLKPIITANLNASGDYSDDKTTFSIHDPVLISLIKYPTGNWKIEEI